MLARVDGHLDLKRTVGFLRTVRNGKLVTVTGNRHTSQAILVTVTTDEGPLPHVYWAGR